MHQKESRVDYMIRRMDQQSGKECSENHSNCTEKKKKQLRESSLRDLWDNIKHINTHIIEVPEREETERWIENLSKEKQLKTSLNQERKDIQVQEAQRVPNKVNSQKKKRTFKGTWQLKWKTLKTKKKICKIASEKQLFMYV